MKSPIGTIVSALNAKRSGSNWMALCPAHDDRNPSLSISDKNGKVLVNCLAGCSQESVIAALRGRGLWSGAGDSGLSIQGLPEGIPDRWDGKPYQTHWTYRNADGSPIGHVVRYENDEGKVVIPFFKRDGSNWKAGAAPEPRPLYGLPGILSAKPTEVVFVVEGEKCAEVLKVRGYCATTSSGGAKAYTKTDWSTLKGLSIVILPDNDEPGRAYAEGVCRILRENGCKVRTLELPELGPGGDIVDWLQAGHSREDLENLLKMTESNQDEPALGQDDRTHAELSENLDERAKRVLSQFDNPCGEFDTANLPPLLRNLIEHYQSTTDAAAITPLSSFLTTASGFHRQKSLIPEFNFDNPNQGYFQRLYANIWTLMIAPSGSFKTTGQNKGARFGHEKRAELRKEIAKLRREYGAQAIDLMKDNSKEKKEFERKLRELRRQDVFLPNKITAEALLQHLSEGYAGTILCSEFGNGWRIL